MRRQSFAYAKGFARYRVQRRRPKEAWPSSIRPVIDIGGTDVRQRQTFYADTESLAYILYQFGKS